MEKISVAIITKNEAGTIDRCLASLKWADEIVVLDGYSTDGTPEIARKYTDKLYQKEFESFPAERDYVMRKTANKWVLSVDADMVFPEEICREIREKLRDNKEYDLFLMKGLTVFLGKEIRHSGWFDCRYPRLFNKEKGGYDINTYHVLDLFRTTGRTGKLRNHFIHMTKESFIDYFGKIKRISYLTALEYEKKGLRITPRNMWFYFFAKPAGIFLYKYIFKLGFLDGAEGLIVGINSAISYYTAYAALWDKQRIDALTGERGNG